MCIVDFLCTVLCVLFHFQNPFDVIKLVFMPREGERDLSLAERSGHMTVTMPTEPAVYSHVYTCRQPQSLNSVNSHGAKAACATLH